MPWGDRNIVKRRGRYHHGRTGGAQMRRYLLALFSLIACCMLAPSPAAAQGSMPAQEPTRAHFICAHIDDRLERELCETRAVAMPGSGAPTALDTFRPLAMGWTLTSLLLGLLLGLLVWRDARSRPQRPFLVPPVVWGLICLVDPILGLLAYWLIHHSGLATRDRGLVGEQSDHG